MGAIKPWEEPFEPFRIIGNLFFVGNIPASSHVVDTGEGLLIFDVGYQSSLHLVIDGLYRLGLDPRDIRTIFITHGHIDHLGGAAALKKLTGARIALGEPDREYANGALDLTYAKELGLTFRETFEPDILLHDGDVFTFGKTKVRAVATPGHTPGAMSYIFNVRDGDTQYVAGLNGGIGINTMCRKFLDAYGLSYSCRDDFFAAMDRLAEEKVDIFLGNHIGHNHTPEKYERLKAGDRLAFVDPDEWSAYALWAKQNLMNLIKREESAG